MEYDYSIDFSGQIDQQQRAAIIIAYALFVLVVIFIVWRIAQKS